MIRMANLVKNGGIAALIVAVGAQALSGQQRAPEAPTPTFRVQVDAIEIDAFVTDAQGNPVTGLTANDFQIVEDGKPQVITSFSQVDISVRAARRADRRGKRRAGGRPEQ